jgi:hypothetical protein
MQVPSPGIVVSGVAGPAVSAWFNRRGDQLRFARDQVQRRPAPADAEQTIDQRPPRARALAAQQHVHPEPDRQRQQAFGERLVAEPGGAYSKAPKTSSCSSFARRMTCARHYEAMCREGGKAYEIGRRLPRSKRKGPCEGPFAVERLLRRPVSEAPQAPARAPARARSPRPRAAATRASWAGTSSSRRGASCSPGARPHG